MGNFKKRVLKTSGSWKNKEALDLETRWHRLLSLKSKGEKNEGQRRSSKIYVELLSEALHVNKEDSRNEGRKQKKNMSLFC